MQAGVDRPPSDPASKCRSSECGQPYCIDVWDNYVFWFALREALSEKVSLCWLRWRIIHSTVSGQRNKSCTYKAEVEKMTVDLYFVVWRFINIKVVENNNNFRHKCINRKEFNVKDLSSCCAKCYSFNNVSTATIIKL